MLRNKILVIRSAQRITARTTHTGLDENLQVMERARRQLNLTDIDEFHQVSSKRLSQEAGVNRLLRQFNGKFNLLQAVYPHHPWNVLRMDRKPPGFWAERENHRKFLDYQAQQLGLNSPLEWSRVTVAQVEQMGGDRLFRFYPNWVTALREIYPEVDWKLEKSRLPRNSSSDLHREWLDEIQKMLGLSSPEQLYHISVDTMRSMGKMTTLLSVYGDKDTLISTLYPHTRPPSAAHFDPHTITRTFWNSEDNRRRYLQWLTRELGFRSWEEWGKLTAKDVRSHHGRALLSRYSTVYRMLEALYPNYSWHSVDPLPEGYWTEERHCITFINRLEDHFSLQSPWDWFSVSPQDIRDLGGAGLLGSPVKDVFALVDQYQPERRLTHIRAQLETDVEKQRHFLAHYEQKWHLHSLADWWKAFPKINQYASFSRIYVDPFSMLNEILPHRKWNLLQCELPNAFWNDTNNQRAFLDQVAEHLGYDSVSKLKHITAREIKELGGSKLLRRYQGSVFETLVALYPEQSWVPYEFKKLPTGFWQDIENQKTFLEYAVAQLKLNGIPDLMCVPRKSLVQLGGTTLLNQYSNIPAMLSALYPDISWNVLARPKVPFNHWKDPDNIRNFVAQFAEAHRIEQPSDWHRISWRQIKRFGGSGVESRFHSLADLLEFVYPNEEWDHELLRRSDKRSTQRWLFKQVQELFPGLEVIEEFAGEPTRRSGTPIELDVYVPALQLAFEYQGEQHYHDLPAFGNLEMYQQRDREKAQLCQESNIHLVTVPYTWDHSIASLQELIRIQAPDITVDVK